MATKTGEFEGGALGIVGGTGNGIHRKLDLQIHCERGCIDMDMVADTTLVRYGDERQETLDPPTEEMPSAFPSKVLGVGCWVLGFATPPAQHPTPNTRAESALATHASPRPTIWST